MLSQSYFMLFGFPDPFMKILYKFFDTCSLCETVKLETHVKAIQFVKALN